jgi:hypothetical protein
VSAAFEVIARKRPGGHVLARAYPGEPTPESAVYTARALLWDAWDAHPVQGYDPVAEFYVDGRLVRSCSLRTLNR